MVGAEQPFVVGEGAHAGAVADPVIDAVALQLQRGRRSARIIGPDDLNRAAVAGAVLFDDNNAVVGLFAGADARQTDHQHLGIL